MNNITLFEAARLLLTYDDYVILVHEHTDGDAVGSAEALRLALRSLGKKATVFSPDLRLSPRFSFLGSPPMPEKLPTGTYVTVDVAEEKLLGDYEGPLSGKILLKLDHHFSGEDFAKYNYTDPTAAAAGEIIYELCSILDVHNREISAALYTAIASDTECFRCSSVTERTLSAAAELYKDGIDARAINTALFESKPLLTMKALSLGIENARFLYNGAAALLCFTLEMRASGPFLDEHLAELPGALRSIKGVELSAVLKQDEKDPTLYRLSARSKSFFDCSALCVRLGGGGHLRAAGGDIRAGSPGEALGILEREIGSLWKTN